MGKYKKLLSNTLIFALGTFGSKVISLVLTSMYTRVMTTEAYSTADLIVTTCNLVLPVMYLGIAEAVIRFGLDDKAAGDDIFSTAFLTVVIGFCVFLLGYPLLRQVPSIRDYMPYFYLFIFNSAMRNIITQYVRASGRIRLFAIDGVITTTMTLLFNLLFILVLNWGIAGYVLSTAVADGLSALYLFLYLKLWRCLKIKGLDTDLVKSMFRYAIPLIPTAVFWWVINSSDRFMVRYFCGDAANGLYTASSHLPYLITLVSAIFTQAWQISAFTDGNDKKEGEEFFSAVFKSYYTFVFIAASGIILLCRPIISIWMGNKFFESWQYVPFLVLAVSFSCLVTFLGTVYNVVKKNIMVTITTFAGALINLVLNLLLIPRIGPQGAAIATFISFFVVFLIRAVDTHRYVNIRMEPLRLAMNMLLLLVQIAASLSRLPYAYLLQCGIIVLIVLCNLKYILFLLRRLLELVRSKEAKDF